MPPLTRLPPALRALPFTSARARSLDVSDRVLQGPAVRRLFCDVYLAAEVEPSLRLVVMGAQLVLPEGTAVGGVTALQLLGLDVGPGRPLRFWTTWPCQVRRAGLRVTRVREMPAVSGRMLAGPAIFRTAAEDVGLPDLVAAGDFLVRHRYATSAQLTEISETGRRGRVLARQAAGLVRERVDSPQETRVRLALVLAGLPEPEVNVALRIHGVFLGTPDLTYRRWGVLLEYEGDHHRSDPEQWSYDLRRYEQMAAAGQLVVRVTRAHLRYARALVTRVHAILVSRGYRGSAPQFTPEWVALFDSVRAHHPKWKDRG